MSILSFRERVCKGKASAERHPCANKNALPFKWARRSEYWRLSAESLEDLLPAHIEIAKRWRLSGGDRPLRDFLWGSIPSSRRTPECEADVANQVRMLVDIGLVKEDELGISDLPEDLPNELLCNGDAKIIVRGVVGISLGNGAKWPSSAKVELWIVSHVDNITAIFPLSVTGKAHPYFTIDRFSIRKELPRLAAILRRYGVYSHRDGRNREAKSRMTTLARVVLAADRVDIVGRDAHHQPSAHGAWWLASYSTLDNRREVLAAISPSEHQLMHIAAADGHFYAVSRSASGPPVFGPIRFRGRANGEPNKARPRQGGVWAKDMIRRRLYGSCSEENPRRCCAWRSYRITCEPRPPPSGL